jgi:hypothetical protein
MGRLSRHTVAHVRHRQHFGSGLFGGQGLRRCSALLGASSKLFRLSARHGYRPPLVSYRSNPMGASRFRNQSGFSEPFWNTSPPRHATRFLPAPQGRDSSVREELAAKVIRNRWRGEALPKRSPPPLIAPL